MKEASAWKIRHRSQECANECEHYQLSLPMLKQIDCLFHACTQKSGYIYIYIEVSDALRVACCILLTLVLMGVMVIFHVIRESNGLKKL